MRHLIFGLAVGWCGWVMLPAQADGAGPPAAKRTPPSDGTRSTHRASVDRTVVARILDRFAFGPSKGQVERVHKAGVDDWFERQLSLRSEPVDAQYKDVDRKSVV